MTDVHLPLPFEAYAGNEPFIFVSYAHKDGEEAYRELSWLHEQGYRVWYDEGIDPAMNGPMRLPTLFHNPLSSLCLLQTMLLHRLMFAMK